MHSCQTKTDLENYLESNTRLPFDFSNTPLQSLSSPYVLPPSQEKPQRFIAKNLLKRNQFNLPQIKEGGVGE